jgi:hypothetical protein
MNNETELKDDEETSKNKSAKNVNKSKASNHRSVDDMDFDDPEYLQYQNMEDIKRKRKNELLQEREQKEEKKLDEENEKDEDENDKEDEEDDEEASDLSSKSEETVSEDNDFKNDHWVSQFEQICLKFNKNSIDVKQFEKLIRLLIEKLDPSKDEDNKKRLCLLTQHMVEFYQSLFVFKSLNSAINVNLAKVCTNIIYELTAKYGGKSTKQEPSMYIVMFRKILTDLNNDYLSLKFNEKTFPKLNIVINLR